MHNDVAHSGGDKKKHLHNDGDATCLNFLDTIKKHFKSQQHETKYSDSASVADASIQLSEKACGNASQNNVTTKTKVACIQEKPTREFRDWVKFVDIVSRWPKRANLGGAEEHRLVGDHR